MPSRETGKTVCKSYITRGTEYRFKFVVAFMGVYAGTAANKFDNVKILRVSCLDLVLVGD